MGRIVINNINAPCKECSERHASCHSECEKYKEFRMKVDTDNAKRRKYEWQHNSYRKLGKRVRKRKNYNERNTNTGT